MPFIPCFLSYYYYHFITDQLFFRQSKYTFIDGNSLREWYGFAIGAAFSGVVGVGFYPIMGNRVWCRFDALWLQF
jgi:hypothetical protein